jgi:hypothetical protein
MKYIWVKQNGNIQRYELHQEVTVDEGVKNLVPSGCEYLVLNSEDVETSFISVYSFEDGKLIVDVEKAKEITLGKFRDAREPILKRLDLEYLRADERGDVELKKEIAERKQKLRDVTLTPLPDDLFELSKIRPEILITK